MVKNKKEFRLLCTLGITSIYGSLWMLIEKLILGQVQDNPVDNIIMLLFVPVIWLASNPIYDKIHATERSGRQHE